MKTLKRWLKDYFDPDEFNDLDIRAISEGLNDLAVRTVWFSGVLEELRRINLEVDKRLLSGSEMGLIDLCARRKAYQDILEAVLSARRTVAHEVRPNPRPQAFVNLDRVTM